MFVLKGIEQLEKAIAKAKKIRPRVEFGGFGHYRVSGSKGFYTVICRKDERGYKTVDCTRARLRRKAWFATTARRLYRFTSD